MSAGLAHTRLSVIDLSSEANQPMRSLTGRSAIVYNGEIYNYLQLREQLVQAGRTFHTRSDTEVLLNGYEHWGIRGLLERLDGMYAFGLIDLDEQAVVMARDPFGKKPCYFSYDSGRQRFLFSSDIRSFSYMGVAREIDWHALGYFFSELGTPERQSIWRAIKKLPAGHYLRLSSAELLLERFWGWPRAPDNGLRWEDALEGAGRLLRSAVRKRLVGDVPCAALLSGGVDSSLVVREMAEASSRPVRTYTVGFKDFPVDERPCARLVAERFGTDHTEVVVDVRDVKALRDLIPEFGEPFADASALPTYIISRAVAWDDKVVLTGDGGDELFAGYYVYYFANKLQLVKNHGPALPMAKLLSHALPTYRTRFLVQLLHAAREPHYRILNRNYGFDEKQLRLLLPQETCSESWTALDREHEKIWREHCEPHEHTLSQALVGCVYSRLVNDHLVKVDRASMFASLEARAPLLDRDLATFAGTLNADLLLREGQPKALLKALAVRHLPREFVFQEKRGFAVPIADWLRGDLNREFRETVLGGRQALVPLDYGFVDRLLAAHEAGEDHAHRLWALYTFHVWAQTAVVSAVVPA